MYSHRDSISASKQSAFSKVSIVNYISALVPSMEQATIAAGQLENASKIGKCASFTNTTTVNLDNNTKFVKLRLFIVSV